LHVAEIGATETDTIEPKKIARRKTSQIDESILRPPERSRAIGAPDERQSRLDVI
jgi:hypothetical protein